MLNYDFTTTKMSHFVGIGLVLGFLLPHTNTAFLLVNPLLCLFYQLYRQNRISHKNNWMVVIPVLLTLLINLPQSVTTKSIFGCIAILLYFFCFPMVGKTMVLNFYFYFILIVIVLTQLVYLLNIPVLVDFINSYYPYSEKDSYEIESMMESINASNVTSFRLGGLYRNANQCSRYLTILLASYLILNSEKSIRRLLPFIFVVFIAVLLTGSRTGFFVAALIIIAFMFVNKKITKTWQYGMLLATIIGFVYLLFVGSSTYRGINVVEGFTNSANSKFFAFVDYIEHENSILRYLFGYLDETRFKASYNVMKYFDADYGYLIFQYGFVGFFAIVLYFVSIFRHMDKTGRVFFVLFLWMISSTIVTSFRAFFVFMLLLSIIYNQHKNQFSK